MHQAEQQTLLRLARDTMEATLRGVALPPLPAIADIPEDFGGAFVSLHHGRRLRGCVGRFNPETGLAATVQAMAVAVLSDQRFRQVAVTLDELPRLHIEVSVLSKMVRTQNPLLLQPGVHGVYIHHGISSGCFLPQVAADQGWDAETFLSKCCSEKAGLPANTWRDPETQVYLFTSEIFEESPPKS